jgi:monoamine oxidase
LGLAAASMLLGGAASASARAAPCSWIAASCDRGGWRICGVTAARVRECGVRVTLLEARRLGGRTFTSDFAGHQVDFGGTWVHWLQPHVWAEISRYGVALDEAPGAVADRIIYLDKPR